VGAAVFGKDVFKRETGQVIHRRRNLHSFQPGIQALTLNYVSNMSIGCCDYTGRFKKAIAQIL
jgi:hypothetical protein